MSIHRPVVVAIACGLWPALFKTWAAELGFDQAVKLLDATLVEEKKTDETLSRLAEAGVNQHAEAA